MLGWAPPCGHEQTCGWKPRKRDDPTETGIVFGIEVTHEGLRAAGKALFVRSLAYRRLTFSAAALYLAWYAELASERAELATSAWIVFAGATLCVFLVTSGAWREIVARPKRLWSARFALPREVRYDFSAREVLVSSAISRSSWDWRAFERFVELKEGVLLVSACDATTYLSKAALGDTYPALLRLFARKLPLRSSSIAGSPRSKKLASPNE